MKLTTYVAAFLIVIVQADNPENVVQLSAPAQDDKANVGFATPAPTFAPTPAPTNFGDPTEQVGHTPTAIFSNGKDATQSISTEGTVGVAYITTRAEYEAEKSTSNNSGSSTTVLIVIIGCVVGVLGVVAAAVVRRKRKVVDVEENDETNYSNSVFTPDAAKIKFSCAIHTPDAAECETDCFNAINGHGV